MLHLRNRKGITLVLVAILLVVLMGTTGIALDLSRAYAFKNQLQTTVDASAMAGAVELMLGTANNAEPMALAYVPENSVNRAAADVTPADVEPGTWDFNNRTFTPEPNGNYEDPSVNSIRVIGRYPTSLTLTQVFNRQTITVTDTAVGAVGYVGETVCLRPWGVRYETLLEVLNNADGGARTVNDNLTPEDINTLTNMTYPANAITLLQGNQNQTEPGNILQVQTDTGWSGNNSYKAAITGCAAKAIAPGDWIDGDPGAGGGQTAGALYDFCNANGGTTGQNQQDFMCIGQPRVKLLIWDIHNGVNGAGFQVRVKYIGVFAVVSFDGQGQTKQITGFFTAMSSDGGFSTEPSPLKTVVLTL